MKKCPYCGHVYSDEDSVCSVDQNPLEACNPRPPSSPTKEEKAEAFVAAGEVAATSKAPDGFRSYGKFHPIDAGRLLKKFEAAGVRFQIELDQKRVYQTIYTFFGGEYVRKIEIIVNNEDDEKALKILNADWKI